MKKNSKQQQIKEQRTKDQQSETERNCMPESDEIGGVAKAGTVDKRSYLHLAGLGGEMLEEATIPTRSATVEKHFRDWPPQASRKPRPEIALRLNGRQRPFIQASMIAQIRCI